MSEREKTSGRRDKSHSVENDDKRDLGVSNGRPEDLKQWWQYKHDNWEHALNRDPEQFVWNGTESRRDVKQGKRRRTACVCCVWCVCICMKRRGLCKYVSLKGMKHNYTLGEVCTVCVCAACVACVCVWCSLCCALVCIPMKTRALCEYV